MEKDKIVTVVSSLLIFYVVPLLGKPELLLDTKLLVVFVMISLLFLSQPAVKMTEAANANKKTVDMLYFTLGMTISQMAMTFDWAYWGFWKSALASEVFVYLGLLMMVGGLAFRVWSIRTLGKFFSVRVEIQDGHRIIRTGPYKILRHPSYLGAYAAVVGVSLFLQSTLGLLVTIASMGLVYRYRIAIEERELCREFGDSYKEYQLQTYRLIPFVW